MKTIIGWLFTLILVVGAIAWFNFVITINLQLDIVPGTVVTITPGQGLSQIAADLETKQLIRSAFFFKVHAVLSGKQTSFQAGEYSLDKDYDIKQLVELLTSGQTLSNEKVILIREGLTIKDMAEYLDSEQLLDGQAFSTLALGPVALLPEPLRAYDWLPTASRSATLEGYLFPDTYRIFKDATAQDLIVKMLANFDTQVTPQLRADITQQNKTLQQIMIMASLIEKEVKSYQDMRLVSGIFWQRLGNGQPLQSCATLAYILGVNKPQYSLADTQIDSPYNTYQNQGLPPGPIANPGLQAIKAAIYPIENDYNYFLSRPDTGETVFAVTYDEHVRNKAKYLP